MAKIQKNLSDTDMLAGYKEKTTFEHIIDDEPAAKPSGHNGKTSANDFNLSFFTPELQEKVGKALVELKLNLYKQGIVDYTIKVTGQNNQILLTAVPAKKKRLLPE
ncbi:MAG: hypothetical protein ABFC84_02425 [Veillonellales bacterium]